ncbi:MAG TPA: acyl-CoA dehydrogenase family protein [Rhizomicrobium sp.]
MSAAEKLDPELESFRGEARAWLAENFPPSLKDRDVSMTAMAGITLSGDAKLWQERMGAKGWGTPTYPKQYGGGGLTGAQTRVLQQEMARIGAKNPIGGMGVMMFGPTLLEYGNDEQKARHVPGIVTGTVRWCQGYSEPNAGSDLAALRTQAIDKGDHYLVNGQKIWTSGAQFADWCFCLVRTDNTKKHEGISFLLIDMKSPGVEVRPIKLISGNSPFCETFFTDVKVPKENLMGPLNGGWTIGKRLLQFERAGLGSGGGSAGRGGVAQGIDEIAKTYVGVDDKGRIADADLRTRIADHQMSARAFQLTIARAQAEAKSNAGPNQTTSIMKNAGSKLQQERAELLIEIMGSQGLGWEGEGFTREEIESTRAWLGGKAVTIYGGTYEIQNNIIAKRILGLLDHQ